MAVRRAVWFVLALLVLAVVLSAGALATVYLAVSRPGTVAAASTLVLPLRGDFPEMPTRTLGALLEPQASLREVVNAIRRAKTDSRITGLLIVADSAPSFWAQAQELRDAILDFRTSGKPTVAYLSYGGDAEYYLATACERIYLMPTSSLALDGLAWYELFLRGTLDRIGAVPDLVHVGDYKTAVNLFTESGFTPAHREMVESLNRAAFDEVVGAIAKARAKTPDEVRALIDEGPFLAGEAFALGLVDGLAYPDELEKLAQVRLDDTGSIETDRYSRATRTAAFGRRSRLALLHIVGTITSGRSGETPDGTRIAGADSIAESLRRIRRDRSIKAVVVRIDSPGGSTIASDLIWRELTLTAQERPVVVSMGNLAASGGYYVATPATTIVAQPGTLTGSIGVYTGKFAVGGTLERLGARIDAVSEGRHADMNSPVRPYTDEERQRVLDDITAFYDHFVDLVARARNMTRPQVDALAQGRVWTGRQAHERGLVDELGGLDRAIAIARERAQIPPDAEVDIVSYPPPRSFYESLLHPFGRAVPGWPLAGTLLGDAEWRALRQLVVPARLFRRGEPLALMPYALLR